MKEVIDREDPEKVAFEFASIHEFHDALSSNHPDVRSEAKILLEVVKYCRDRGVQTVFYGFKNYQKERLYDRISERKSRLHSFFQTIIDKTFKSSRALEQPYWAQRSRFHGLHLGLSRLNDRFFLKNPYHLHETVLKEKVKSLPKFTLIFSPYRYYGSLKKCVG